MSNRSEKGRALFLVALMVISVVGMTVAFGGAAAAATGSMTLDNPAYGPDDTVGITVSDSDLNGQAATVDTVVVDVDSNTESAQKSDSGANGDLVDDSSETITTSFPVYPGSDGTVSTGDFSLTNGDQGESVTGVTVNNDGTVDVTVTDGPTSGGETGSEEEINYDRGFQLSETDVDTGTFTGSLALSKSTSDSTTLKIGDGDTITVTFADQADSDISQTATADTTADQIDLSSATTADTDDDGQVDQITATLSDLVEDDTVVASDFTVAGGTVDSVGTGATVDDTTVVLTVSGLASADTSVTPGVTLASGSVDDVAGQSGPVTDTTVTAADGAAPILLSVRHDDGNNVVIKFSESVEASAGSMDTGDGAELDYIDNTGGSGATAGLSVSPSEPSQTYTVSANADLTTDDIGTDAIKFLETSIQDTSGNALVTTPNQAIKVAGLPGQEDQYIDTSIGGNADQALVAGSEAQSLGLIKVKDISGGDSPMASRTILTMPAGVTINESASSILVTATSGGLNVDSSNVVDENTLRVEHSGSSENGQIVRVSGLVVDAANDVSASQQFGTVSDINVDYATGNLDSGLLTAYKPGAELAGTTTISAGTSGQNLGNDITISTSTVDKQIANQTDIVVYANESNGITFDDSLDLSSGTTADDLITGTDANVDDTADGLTLTESSLTIPVTSNFSAGETISIDSNVLQLNASGTASSGALFQVEIEPVDSTGTVTAEQTSTGNTIDINKPTVRLGNDGTVTHSVGLNGQLVTEAGTTGPTNNAISIEDTAGSQMAAGENVTITLNNSDVTFDTTQGVEIGDKLAQNPGLTGFALADTGPINTGSGVDVAAATINENSLEIELSNQGSSETSIGDYLVIDDLKLNASANIADDEVVHFSVTTRSGSSTPAVISTSNETDSGYVISEQKPNVAFNNEGGDNATMAIDNDGRTGFEVGADGPADDGAVAIDGDSSTQAAANTYVNITLESDTGVTFDTRKTITADDQGNDADDTVFVTDSGASVDVANTKITEDTIAIELGADGLDNGENLQIDEVFINGTATAANTTLDVTTNTGDNTVTTAFDRFIITQADEPGAIYGDASITVGANDDNAGPTTQLDRDGNGNSDYGTTDSGEATVSIETGETAYGSVYVQDGAGDFGAADATLEIVDTPDGASGQSLNTTSLTTATNGVADFEFVAGDGIGTYIVNATTANDKSVNITYDVTSGQASQLNVTNVDNALVESGPTTNEDEVAAVRVRVEDDGGNLVTDRNVDVAVSLSGDGQLYTGGNTGSGLAVEMNDDGTAFDDGTADVTDSDDNGRFNYKPGTTHDGETNEGDFYIFIKDGTVEDVDVSLTDESAGTGVNAITGDEDTTTFYERVDSVDVSFNVSSSALVGTDVQADAVAQASDGTTIEVPRLASDGFTLGNATVATIADEDASTNASGVVSSTLTADAVGTTVVNQTIKGVEGSSTLTTLADESVYEVSNLADETVQYDADPINITADVENTGTVAGTQTIDLSITDAGTEVLSDSVADVEIDRNNSTTVTFVDVDVGSLSTGEYNTTVSSADTSVEGNLTVEAAPLSVAVDPTSVTVNNETDLTVNVTSDGEYTAFTSQVYSSVNETVKPELEENAGPCESGIPPARVYSYTRIHTEGHR